MSQSDFNPSVVALLALALKDAQFVDRMTEDRVRLGGIAGAVFAVMQSTRNDGRGLDAATLRRDLLSNERALGLIDAACKEFVPFENYAQHRDAIKAEQLRWAIDALANRYGALNSAEDKRQPVELLRDLESEVQTLTERFVIGQEVSAVMDGKAVIQKMLAEMKSNHAKGIATGIRKLDRLLLGGFRGGQLVIVASRPGVGKSALMCGWTEHMLSCKVPVLVSSIEMTVGELMPRIISQRTRIPHEFITTVEALNKLPEEVQAVYTAQVKKFSETEPIFVDETAEVTLPYLRAVIRRYVRSHGVKVVFVDYLQLMKTESKDSRVQELDELSRGLKVLAKELRIVIVALAQLNRQADLRKPRMSDLRESGGIEANANIICLLSEIEDQTVTDGEIQKVALDVVKNRGGAKGKIELDFTGRYFLFSEPVI
jgi:replicative DNA helicase